MMRIPSRALIFCVAIVQLCAWLATMSGELLVKTQPVVSENSADPVVDESEALTPRGRRSGAVLQVARDTRFRRETRAETAR